MSNNLVILESPGKIGAVKSYLGSNYKVIASVGHVRDLPKSTLGIDIDNGFSAHYINLRGKGELIKELRKEAKNIIVFLYSILLKTPSFRINDPPRPSAHSRRGAFFVLRHKI